MCCPLAGLGLQCIYYTYINFIEKIKFCTYTYIESVHIMQVHIYIYNMLACEPPVLYNTENAMHSPAVQWFEPLYD
jgi:hypothetical protein